MAKSDSIRFNLADQIDTFVEVVPTDSIHEADAINKTDADLGAKFRIRSGFASFDRTHMRLADTHDAIVNTSAALIIHPLLLT
jgi:hypothetical protein